MSIPPLLSSSPPPLEESGSVLDHDDDFGEFSDYASVGAVSSSSVTDVSSVFRPLGTPELSGGLDLGDACLKPNTLEETDEWSEFDTAAIQPQLSLEPTQTDSADSLRDQKPLTDGLYSDDTFVEEHLPVYLSCEETTNELPAVSLSTSQVAVSEQMNSGDVLSGCHSDEEVECSDENDENSNCEEQTLGKCEFCEDVNTLSIDANLQCEVEEIKHHIEEDELPSSVGDNHDLEFDNAVDYIVEDIDNDDFNSFHISSTVAISDRNERAVADDNQSVSSEDDFVDNFQSFSNDTETDRHCVNEVSQLCVSNNEDPAFMCHELQEASTSVEASAVIDSSSACSRPVRTSSEADFPSVVQDSTSVARLNDNVSTDQPVTHEQILASDDQREDDFDDFEEFVAAKDGLAQHQPTVVSSTYQWSAFENTAADSDEWAAFQDSDQPLSTNSSSEVVATNITHTQQPSVAFSGQLSKDSLMLSLYACFESSEESGSDAVITPLHRTFECPDAVHVTDSKPSKELRDGVKVWNGLRVMENTPALKYQWQQSRCNDLLLRSINVDARNILNPPRKSAAPAFATNLGLLEPKKAVPDAFASAVADSALPHGNMTFSAETARQRHADAAGCSRPTDVKKPEKELLEVLELPECGATQNTKSRSSPLDSILKAITSTATTSNSSLVNTATMKDGTTEPLSAEASAVLSRLPDLSFMHSKVLMFPVSDCAN